MKKTIYILCSLALVSSVLTSCDKFLDVLPDNRAEITTPEKVQALLASAYPDNDYIIVSEFSSDNVECTGDENPYTDRFVDQVYAWKDVTESDNESPESLYESLYHVVATCNLALEAIDEMGGATTPELKASVGEAKICRAYAHFMLANIFCMPYNEATAGKDLGIPYSTTVEHTLQPTYERGTVAQVYEAIDKDIREGLPLVSDAFYKVGKYHFNEKAAYAFAARFYLYYQKWEKVVEYASMVLGTSPSTMLRDCRALGSMTQSFAAVSQEYVNAENNCNLLMLTAYSAVGLNFGPYYSRAKYTTTPNIASNEAINATHPWGKASYYSISHTYPATNLSRTIFWRLPYQFEYTDPVAGIGYRHTTYPAFTADECLLNRAEAYVMLNKYDEAAADINLWLSAIAETFTPITPEKTVSFYAGVDWCEDLVPTVKKHLNPPFSIGPEGEVQECMIQAVLAARRIETYQCGLRWFDVRRYGIEIVRRTLNASGTPMKCTDRLLKDDPRMAMQLPKRVIDAGMTPNPRNK